MFLIAALSSRRARMLATPTAILIALHYALALHAAHADLDVYTVLVGLGLFLLFETVDLSIDLADIAPQGGSALAYRVTTTLAVATTGAALAVLAVLSRSLFSSGATGVVIGAICALGTLALPVWQSQRSRH
jgi:hypothetical protein